MSAWVVPWSLAVTCHAFTEAMLDRGYVRVARLEALDSFNQILLATHDGEIAALVVLHDHNLDVRERDCHEARGGLTS